MTGPIVRPADAVGNRRSGEAVVRGSGAAHREYPNHSAAPLRPHEARRETDR